MTAKFISIEPAEATTATQRQLEHRTAQIYASIQEEAAKDILAAADKSVENKTTDLETMILN